ncbi:peptidoglycan/LPS O-acetylase OafA/YrhL [Bradyrhizobium japonicum]
MINVTPRIAALDCLRGLAAIVVLMWHYQFFFDDRPLSFLMTPVYVNGQVAVDTFFVISGFVLTYVYSQRVNSTRSFWIYALHRSARLYPLHLACLVATGLIFLGFYLRSGTYGYVYDQNDVYHFLLNLALLQYVGPQAGFSFNGPSWSISTEFWANMIVGLLLLGARKHLAAVSAAIVFATAALSLITNSFGEGHKLGGFLEPNLIRTFCGLFAGVLVFQAWRLRSGLPQIAACGAIVVGIITLLCGMMVPRSSQFAVYAEMAAALIGSTTLVWGCATSSAARRIGESVAGRWIGDISYSVYMWHFPIAALFVLTDLPRAIDGIPLLVTYLVATFGAATVSYRKIEQPSRYGIKSLADDQKSVLARGVTRVSR